jgi:nitroreductase
MMNEKEGSWSVPLAMPIEETMRTQRAIRRFKPDPVDDDLLLHLIELATKAPAGGGRQYAEFIIVRDGNVKAQLARLNRVAWSSYGSIWRWFARNDQKTLREMKAVDYLVAFPSRRSWQVSTSGRSSRLSRTSCLRRGRRWTANLSSKACGRRQDCEFSPVGATCASPRTDKSRAGTRLSGGHREPPDIALVPAAITLINSPWRRGRRSRARVLGLGFQVGGEAVGSYYESFAKKPWRTP